MRIDVKKISIFALLASVLGSSAVFAMQESHNSNNNREGDRDKRSITITIQHKPEAEKTIKEDLNHLLPHHLLLLLKLWNRS